MNSETKTCQNCKKEFTIEPEDFSFYEKIKVPPPTFCPECRRERRMAFRNERSLYKDMCDLCGKPVISMYSGDRPFKAYCYDCWFSDKWDVMSYGRDYDFSRPFFEQFRELLADVPRLALESLQNQNAPYSNFTWLSKDVYMAPSTFYSENIAYSHKAFHDRDVFDSNVVTDSEFCYETMDTNHAVHSAYLQNCRDCMDSYFLYNCAGCKSCFMGSNLRSRSYVFRNEQLTKEEYERKMAEVGLGSSRAIQSLKIEFADLKKNSIQRFAFTNKVVNVSGNHIINSKNIFKSFNVDECENLRYCTQALKIKDCMDLHGAGDGGELSYEGVNVAYHDSRNFFSSNTYENIVNVEYSDYCRGGSNLFGCVGVRKKDLCILNKQYSKEEYEALLPKIKKHINDMPYTDAKGRIYKYGEFFPIELSPFAYNETIAQEYFPLTAERAVEEKYPWRNETAKDYAISVKADELPDDIKDVKDDILNQTIECPHGGKCGEQCTGVFRIIAPELQFLRRIGLPLPRLCPNCRHYGRLKQGTPLRLWRRSCMCDKKNHFHGGERCSNEFETAFAPDRPEIVYCEECYQKEVA